MNKSQRVKLWIFILILACHVFYLESGLSSTAKSSGKQPRPGPRLEEIININTLRTDHRTKSDHLKNAMLCWDDRILSIVREFNIRPEVRDIQEILKAMETDSQKQRFLHAWKIRNKTALELLAYWQKHPEEISGKVVFEPPRKKLTDRKLANMLSKKEKLLRHYINNPLAETNRLEYFLINPAEYPKTSEKGNNSEKSDANHSDTD